MATPAAVDPPVLQCAPARADHGSAAHRVRLPIINSGVVLISTAGSVLMYAAANPSSADGDLSVYAFVAFLLFLLGLWLTLLALAADQFPRAARVGVAVARSLQYYLFDPHMPAGLLQPAIALADRGSAARRVRLLIVNSGVLLISTAGSVLMYATANTSSAVGDQSAYALVAFMLFLLGVWLALLALVADQIPRAARIGVAITTALQDYLFGGN